MEFIPLSKLPSQRLNVVLDGQNCTISLLWRQRSLYMDLAVGAADICRGAICQNGAEIVQSPTPAFAGELHFFDAEGDEAPRWDGLWNGTDGRWVLVYLEEGEETPESLEF